MSKSYCTNDFDYSLPQAQIAQFPLPERTGSRLLQLSRQEQSLQHRHFAEIEGLLQANDVLILNNTKVFPARVFGHKQSGGRVECLIERILSNQQVLSHVRASKAPRPGSVIVFDDQTEATVQAVENGLYLLEFPAHLLVLPWLEQVGRLPLPPYIEREVEAADQTRYQTVFAERVGAIAAPTAGLHFDVELLNRIRARGIATAELTLHVGAGTFKPVRVDKLEEHRMHGEYIEVPQAVCDAIALAKSRGGRVVAVGTTVVRALESAARSGTLQPYQGETDIFIYPGFKFRCVDALITNFHLPKSTLLMLVSAFAGYDFTLQAYKVAVEQGYRFFSYGDAMYIG